MIPGLTGDGEVVIPGLTQRLEGKIVFQAFDFLKTKNVHVMLAEKPDNLINAQSD